MIITLPRKAFIFSALISCLTSVSRTIRPESYLSDKHCFKTVSVMRRVATESQVIGVGFRKTGLCCLNPLIKSEAYLGAQISGAQRTDTRWQTSGTAEGF